MRLIDGDALMEQIKSISQNDKVDKFKAVRFVVENAQTIEVDKIVYCGYCKYMQPDGHCTQFADDKIKPSSSDFCSAGERKEVSEDATN